MKRILFWLLVIFPGSFFAAEPDIRRDETVTAVERVMPCVVNIATANVVEYEDFYQPSFRDFFGLRGTRRQQEEYSVGSGVIIDAVQCPDKRIRR